MSVRSAQAQEPAGRAKLRAAVVERLLYGMNDLQGRLLQFLENPGRQGVVSLGLVFSESTVTLELWNESGANPEHRAHLARTLGVAPEADDASLLRAVLPEVHQAFVDFQASLPGRECLRRYEEVLQACEEANVLPVVPGHDTGPLLAELARLGIAHGKDFSRSLLVNPLLLAVGLHPEEGSDTQVRVVGLNVPQLGALVAQVRGLNPLLTNRQVRQLILRATKDLRNANRKNQLQAGVDRRAQEMARMRLRLQAAEWIPV
jgi:hypothetical protein